jgi:imidazolonepropionase-like amidohydrolase
VTALARWAATLADLVVWSRDILGIPTEEIPGTVEAVGMGGVLVVRGGEIVYRRYGMMAA